MSRKLTTFFFCVAALCPVAAQNSSSQNSLPVAAEIPTFRIANPQLSLALNEPGEKLFGNGRANFSAKAHALPIQPKKTLTTCYAMRSYNFDNSDMPQMTGQSTCTDSQLASEKFAGDETKLGRSTVILFQGR
jgi:hypothetical protein